MCFQLTLFWLSALACGRQLNDEHTKQNSTDTSDSQAKSTNGPNAFSKRSYGFKSVENSYPNGYSSAESDTWMPTDSSKIRSQTIREPEIDEYGEPEKSKRPDGLEEMDSGERFIGDPEKVEVPKNDNGDSFEHVKRVKEVSIISLKPRELDKDLDPINEEQTDAPKKTARPMRDLSIIIRNRHLAPVLLTRRVPARIIPRRPFYHHRPQPHRPHAPVKPKHKPRCKPCGPKGHKKKHGHKPKKPKKKPKHKGHKGHNEHCHKPKKPHFKKLLYYAPMPTGTMYNYGSRMPPKLVKPSTGYDVKESPENEDVESETEKPFQQDVEDDMEEHRLDEMGEMNEPMSEIGESFDEEEPSESKLIKSVKNITDFESRFPKNKGKT
ncbi:Hypothetical protein CINCED_3A012860 [Cinara cedri]|uniref:Uncharacterized protein n=1 Tax=Cinara cedri TaxID=506608 RepID=A0A5E4M867_9HEMI|nr:Hypothetical protein CINCED_3A012860 [Cinara cedri]